MGMSSLRNDLIVLYTRNKLFGIDESEYLDFKYIYNVEEDELIITGYSSYDERVVIDGVFDSIGSNAFTYDELKEVVLHKNIKTIYASSFITSGLEKINLENVKYIGDSAFAFTNLSGDLDLSNCEILGSDAFLYTYIENIKFGHFIHISKNAFAGVYNLIKLDLNNVYLESMALSESSIKKVVVNNSCLMEENACALATNLEEFEAKELEYLSKHCFYLSVNIKRIYLPKLIQIGENLDIERFIVY